MIISLLYLSTLASIARAHVQINFPLGEWSKDAQSTGALCGGLGGRSSGAYAWGARNAFISVSGDAGDSITVEWAEGNSTSSPPPISSKDDFATLLLSNATLPESGNFCFNVTIPSSAGQSGQISTLYVEAANRNGSIVSSCADVAVIRDLSIASSPVITDGQPVLDPSTGNGVNYYEYYCSNSTILALDTCSCHCHGATEHCDASCSPERVEKARAQCLPGTSSLSPSSTLVSSPVSASTRPSASATAAANAAATTAGTSDAAHRLQIAGWTSLLLGGLAVCFV